MLYSIKFRDHLLSLVNHMFWKKKRKSPKRPFAVFIHIELNLSTLSDIALKFGSPTITDMSNTWDKCNCVSTKITIVGFNTVNDKIIILSGADSHLYNDLQFQIKLPFHFGGRSDDPIKFINVTTENDMVFFTINNIVFMAFPLQYFIKLLRAEPLAVYNDLRKDRFGEASEDEISITNYELDESYKIPIITSIASNFFQYKNTAAKLDVLAVDDDSDFPVNLSEGMREYEESGEE
jgi:hypothetical protein